MDARTPRTTLARSQSANALAQALRQSAECSEHAACELEGRTNCGPRPEECLETSVNTNPDGTQLVCGLVKTD